MITDLFSYLDTLTGNNQMAVAAITAIVFGGLTYLVRQAPTTIWNFILRHFTTTMTIDNGTREGRELFIRLSEYMRKASGDGNLIRTYAIDNNDSTDRPVLNIGYGNHLTRVAGRWVLVHKGKLDSSGSEQQKKEMSLRVWGRSADLFRTLTTEMDTQEEVRDKIRNYRWNGQFWCAGARLDRTQLDDIPLNPETREHFQRELGHFMKGPELHRRLGLPHKFTAVLYGESGSGKTSLIRAVAGTYKRDIAELSIGAITDRDFQNAIHQLPANAILIMEDFDASTASHQRSDTPKASIGNDLKSITGLDTSTILNTLDGICSLNDTIIFMTTNHIELIDEAILRSGRCDLCMELPRLNTDTVQAHFERVYPELVGRDIPYTDMWLKELNKVVFTAKDDATMVETALRAFTPPRSLKTQTVHHSPLTAVEHSAN